MYWTVINIECYMPCVSICDNKDMPYTYMLIIYTYGHAMDNH